MSDNNAKQRKPLQQFAAVVIHLISQILAAMQLVATKGITDIRRIYEVAFLRIFS